MSVTTTERYDMISFRFLYHFFQSYKLLKLKETKGKEVIGSVLPTCAVPNLSFGNHVLHSSEFDLKNFKYVPRCIPAHSRTRLVDSVKPRAVDCISDTRVTTKTMSTKWGESDRTVRPITKNWSTSRLTFLFCFLNRKKTDDDRVTRYD